MAVITTDADDMLWANSYKYDSGYTECFRYFCKVFGRYMPSLKEVHSRFWKIDGDLFKTWGVKRGRVAMAMLALYREIRAWVEWRYGVKIKSAEHEDEIERIGDTPFNFSKDAWDPIAYEVFSALKATPGTRLCLLTSY